MVLGKPTFMPRTKALTRVARGCSLRRAMQNSTAIYVPGDRVGYGARPFGKDVANYEMFRAIARYMPGDEQLFLMHQQPNVSDLSAALFGGGEPPKKVVATSIFQSEEASRVGCVFRGKADLADLAWLRRRQAGDDRAYSLIGLVHSLAPPAMRSYMADAVTAPVQPWDALLCTSPAVQDHLKTMLGDHAAYLADRFGGTAQPLPHLPLVPLGVELERFERMAAEPGNRQRLRARLGIAEDEIAVLWVGRLSFFEKSFPQPTYEALQEAARRTGKKIHFLQVGWFPNEEAQKLLYEETALFHAPDVEMHFLDGNDRAMVNRIWSAADIFVSLVDNIQETFGITPLEAMASGLPVVVSDWDGYKFTVEDGVQGFRIPTVMPAADMPLIIERHIFGFDSYQSYVAGVAQHTAVDVGAAADAFTRLIEDPGLRRRMGQAGRERVRSTFDWPVVIDAFSKVVDELAVIRKDASAFGDGAVAINPVKGDPFRQFSHFATDELTQETVVFRREGWTPDKLRQLSGVVLDGVADVWRTRSDWRTKTLERLAADGPLPVSQLVDGLTGMEYDRAFLTIGWMIKLGILGWQRPGA